MAGLDELTVGAEQWRVRSTETCTDGTDSKIKFWHYNGLCGLVVAGTVLAVGLFLTLY